MKHVATIPMASTLIALTIYGTIRAETPAERGYKALTETAFIAATWRTNAYENAWKRWAGVDRKPDDYTQAFADHYGLAMPPYPNNKLPMGLRSGQLLLARGVAMDCMLCHAGTLFGKGMIGLGNNSLDIQALFEDLSATDGLGDKLPFTFSNVRGTSEAAGFAVFLMGFRDKDLKLVRPRRDLGLHDDLCEDVPAWWLLKKKKTMYYTGGADAHSVRSKMQFMMTPLTTRADFERHEPAFRDVDQYLRSIEAPKYPFAVDRVSADRGREVFNTNCAQCHGTYGDKPTYPNKIVPLDEIGTDPRRFQGLEEKFGLAYNESWFAKERKGWFVDQFLTIGGKGYQAPPLDGIWATAPYLHNGSVPNLQALLKSSERPKIFTRSYANREEDFDPVRVGWKHQSLTAAASIDRSGYERRKIYDTTQSGRSNRGHTFGDTLTDEERAAVIEYLKTL